MSKKKITAEQVLHALGDPTRRAIVEKLNRAPQSVSKLAAPLNITLTAVVQHLQVLEKCGLVHTEKIGRVRSCRLDTVGFDILAQWIANHRSLWEQRLDRLGDILADN